MTARPSAYEWNLGFKGLKTFIMLSPDVSFRNLVLHYFSSTELSRSEKLASSPSASALTLLPSPAIESNCSSVVFDLSQQINAAMENMVNRLSEIDEHAFGIMEDIQKTKEKATERKKVIEEEKERLQKAALVVLNMFNSGGN